MSRRKQNDWAGGCHMTLPDHDMRKKQIEQSAADLLIAIESLPGDHNAEIAARLIRSAVKLATGEFKSAAVFVSVEG